VPDPRKASAIIQQALALAATTPPNATPSADNASSINSASSTDSVANDDTAQTGAAKAAAQPSQAAIAPSIITVDATASSSDGGVFVRRAVIRIDSSKPIGYTVLAWERGGIAP
jgi:hypothetical protein